MKRLNWPIWLGFLLSIVALLSYPFVFVNWPITRDFPWANFVLFAVALALLFVGVRRAFTPERRRLSKVVGSLLATLGVIVLGFFIFTFFIASRWMPAAKGAPQVGQQAPDFTLNDTNSNPVSLSELRSSTTNGKAARGVLLIFYRGYW